MSVNLCYCVRVGLFVRLLLCVFYIVVFYMDTLHANFNIKYMYLFHCANRFDLNPQGAICAPHTGDTHVPPYGMGWEAALMGTVYSHYWCGAAGCPRIG